MNSKKKNSNRRLIIITVAILALSCLSLVFGRSNTHIENIFKDSVSSLEYYLFKKPIELIQDIFHEYDDLKNVYEENKVLKEQLEALAREQAMNDVLSHEIEELKALLDLEALPTEYKVKYASVMGRDIESWNNKMIINAGELSGISENMIVMSSKGIIGRVTSVSELTSTVTLLSSESYTNQLPVMILDQNENTSVYGILETFNVENQAYEVTLLDANVDVQEGSKVVTSGLGEANGGSPRGILVGTVDRVVRKSDQLVSTIYVKPSADYRHIHYVAIIQREDSLHE